jgi:hypothetical protein
MIDFITEIVNTIGIPIILIGSYKALYLFKNSLANTRRGIPNEFSENITGNMPEDSWEWDEFIKNLWDLQYTRKYSDLTEDIKKAMYDNTIGIPDFAVKLFMHVQSKAIVNGGDEKMTATLIRQVAGKSLRLVQPIFERIRSGDQAAYSELDDIIPDWAPLNGYIKEASHRLNIYGNLAEDHAWVLQQKNKYEVLKKLTDFALCLVKPVSVAENLANQVYEACGGMDDLDKMFAQVALLAMDIEKLPDDDKGNSMEHLPKKRNTKQVKPTLEEGDIRYIVQEGYRKGKTTEEALEEFELVRGANELLEFIS